MPGLGDLVKKAFYLGVGVAAAAAETASGKLAELKEQAQKLTDEMVAKGEITTEEAKRLVDEMVTRAQQQPIESSTTETPRSEPRRIEISSEENLPTKTDGQNVDALRQQVTQLQEELRRLKQE